MTEHHHHLHAGYHRKIVYLLALTSVSANAAGNCMLRAGLRSLGDTSSISRYLWEMTNVWFVLGVLVLAGWFMVQLSLLSWADLTFVLPVTSVSYVLIAIIGAFLMDEHVSPAHWCGILLILFGVILVGRTKPLTSHRERL